MKSVLLLTPCFFTCKNLVPFIPSVKTYQRRRRKKNAISSLLPVCDFFAPKGNKELQSVNVKENSNVYFARKEKHSDLEIYQKKRRIEISVNYYYYHHHYRHSTFYIK